MRLIIGLGDNILPGRVIRGYTAHALTLICEKGFSLLAAIDIRVRTTGGLLLGLSRASLALCNSVVQGYFAGYMAAVVGRYCITSGTSVRTEGLRVGLANKKIV